MNKFNVHYKTCPDTGRNIILANSLSFSGLYLYFRGWGFHYAKEGGQGFGDPDHSDCSHCLCAPAASRSSSAI